MPEEGATSDSPSMPPRRKIATRISWFIASGSPKARVLKRVPAIAAIAAEQPWRKERRENLIV